MSKLNFYSHYTPVFSVTWSFRNYSNMLIWCSRNISDYFQCMKTVSYICGNWFLNFIWMNEWMMHLYSAFIVYCHTPKALYNHVGGLSSTTTSVQHPLGWFLFIYFWILKNRKFFLSLGAIKFKSIFSFKNKNLTDLTLLNSRVCGVLDAGPHHGILTCRCPH